MTATMTNGRHAAPKQEPAVAAAQAGYHVWEDACAELAELAREEAAAARRRAERRAKEACRSAREELLAGGRALAEEMESLAAFARSLAAGVLEDVLGACPVEIAPPAHPFETPCPFENGDAPAGPITPRAEVAAAAAPLTAEEKAELMRQREELAREREAARRVEADGEAWSVTALPREGAGDGGSAGLATLDGGRQPEAGGAAAGGPVAAGDRRADGPATALGGEAGTAAGRPQGAAAGGVVAGAVGAAHDRRGGAADGQVAGHGAADEEPPPAQGLPLSPRDVGRPAAAALTPGPQLTRGDRGDGPPAPPCVPEEIARAGLAPDERPKNRGRAKRGGGR